VTPGAHFFSGSHLFQFVIILVFFSGKRQRLFKGRGCC
jgi:hypothetical protein